MGFCKKNSPKDFGVLCLLWSNPIDMYAITMHGLREKKLFHKFSRNAILIFFMIKFKYFYQELISLMSFSRYILYQINLCLISFSEKVIKNVKNIFGTD